MEKFFGIIENVGVFTQPRASCAPVSLARLSHHPSTATAPWRALAGFRSVGVLDIVSTMPARTSVAKATQATPLHRLATNGDEKCGLGLYGAWQRTEYTDRQRQIFIGVFIVVWLLSAAVGLLALIYLVACPVYAWLFWRKHEYTANTRLGFAIAAGILAVASLAVLGAGGASNRSGAADSSGCTLVLTRGNCTYYRDSDCRVIARQCR